MHILCLAKEDMSIYNVHLRICVKTHKHTHTHTHTQVCTHTQDEHVCVMRVWRQKFARTHQSTFTIIHTCNWSTLVFVLLYMSAVASKSFFRLSSVVLNRACCVSNSCCSFSIPDFMDCMCAYVTLACILRSCMSVSSAALSAPVMSISPRYIMTCKIIRRILCENGQRAGTNKTGNSCAGDSANARPWLEHDL